MQLGQVLLALLAFILSYSFRPRLHLSQMEPFQNWYEWVLCLH